MKTPKTKATPDKTPAAKSADMEQPSKWPTPLELAMIAATLARNPTTDTPQSLVDYAMKLFLKAQRVVHFHWIEVRLHTRMEDTAILLWGAQEFPLKRDDFLRVVLPKYKSRADVLKRIAKAFLRDTLHDKNQKKPTKDEIAAAYSDWPSYKYPNEATRAADSFKEWHSEYVKSVRRVAGKASAAKRTGAEKQPEKK